MEELENDTSFTVNERCKNFNIMRIYYELVNFDNRSKCILHLNKFIYFT